VAKVLTATPDSLRGSVRLKASGIPAGPALVTRQARGIPEPIRGGDLAVSTGGFIKEDPEPPFGEPLIYRVNSNPTNRNIQSNRVLNPKFKNDLTNWTLPAGRATARDTGLPLPPRDGLASLRVGPLVGGETVGGLDQRLIAKTSPMGLTTGRWFISGQMRYDSPDIWLWQDVKDAGTWQTVKNRGTWQTVRDAQSTLAGTPFATFHAAVLSPTSATTTRTNLARNARVAIDAPAGYGPIAGTGTTPTTAQVLTGGPTVNTPTFRRATFPAATTAVSGGIYAGVPGSTGANPYVIPVTAGQPYTASMDVRCSKAQRIALTAIFFDAAGATLGTTIVGTAAVLAANTWTRLSVAGTAPANAVQVIISATAVVGTGGVNWAAGDTLDISRVLVEQTALTAPGTFFDGDSVDTVASPTSVFYNWAGAQYASASTEASTSGVLVLPFQVIGVQATDNGGWVTFQAWVDIPAGAPANCQLAFYQGTLTREYAVTWWLTTVMVTPDAEMTAGALTPYFDGDTALPANPAANLAPGYDWIDVSHDSSISWTGTLNASASVFTGPSVIAAEVTTQVDAPPLSQLPRNKLPIMLSDPILPQVNTWFELMEIGDLSFAARQDLFDVIGRGAQIAVGSRRGWATGELRLMTYTLEAASVAERMFDPGRILFLRNPDPRFPESVWYLAIGDVTQGRVSPNAAWTPERLWRVPFVKVERPVGLIAAASSVSWADVKANYTWDELRQKRTDWLDAAVTPA
jgi:hypothetical protein